MSSPIPAPLLGPHKVSPGRTVDLLVACVTALEKIPRFGPDKERLDNCVSTLVFHVSTHVEVDREFEADVLEAIRRSKTASGGNLVYPWCLDPVGCLDRNTCPRSPGCGD